MNYLSLFISKDFVIVIFAAGNPLKEGSKRAKNHCKKSEESEDSSECFEHGVNLP